MPDLSSGLLAFAGVAFVILLPVVFIVGAVVELIRWRSAIPQFVAWGYPPYWPVVTSVLKIGAGATALFPSLRVVGLLLLLILCIAGLATVIRWHTTQFYPPAFGMTLVTLAAVLVAVNLR